VSERRLKGDFNTAITGINPDTGAWSEKTHNTTVLPLRGKIMQIDGVVGCHIARYGLEVTYLQDRVTKTALTRAVKAAVAEIANNADIFFPLRGKKTPRLTIPRSRPSTTRTWHCVEVEFNTDLHANAGEELTTAIKEKLKLRLMQVDGARRVYVTQRCLQVCFDKDATAEEGIVAHLQQVVREILESRADYALYFPFGDPTCVYRTFRTNVVI
jgi:hypothetical protein